MRNEEIQKIYWSTTEIAGMINESASCVRHWAKVFGIRAKIAMHNNHLYTRQSVAKFHMVKTLVRKEKFTIDGAKMKLQSIPI